MEMVYRLSVNTLPEKLVKVQLNHGTFPIVLTTQDDTLSVQISAAFSASNFSGQYALTRSGQIKSKPQSFFLL